MKKILSAALAALMVSSSVLCMGTTASAVETTESTQYATAKALRHEGGFSWYEMEGSSSKKAEAGDCLFTTEEDESDATIQLDGYVDEDEWGSPTLMLDPEYMAQTGDNTITSDNTFYWGESAGVNKFVAPSTTKVWFRWDDDYMYIAAVVYDYDGQQNANNAGDTWDGDAIQFRIDPLGPNSGVAEGEKYEARPQVYVDGELTRVYNQPWANTIVKNPTEAASESYSAVGNFGIAFTTRPSDGSSGKVSIYDMGLRYDPVVQPVTQSDGTPVLDSEGNQTYETVYSGKDMYPGTNNPYGDVYASVKSYSAKNTTYKLAIETHYEVAIPWSQVSEDFAPTVNYALGMSFGVINAGYGSTAGCNSWYSWGSGIFGKAMQLAPDTLGGSNCVILSDEDEFSVDCDHTNWLYPTCEEGYVCADCGTIERGFVAGHVYEFTNGVSPTATTAGGMTADCSVCGDHQEIVIPAKSSKLLVGYDQNSTFGNLSSDLWGFNVKFYATRNPDDLTPHIDSDGNPLTSLTQTFQGYNVIDGTYPSIGTYFQINNAKSIYDKYKGDNSEFDNSYAISYDFYIDSNGLPQYDQTWTNPEDGSVDQTDSEYRNGIWQWFGGKSNLSYMAGYFLEEDKVIIMEYYGDNVKEGKSYHAIAESDTLGINVGEWHNMRFEYDNEYNVVFVYIDNELVTYAWYDGFASGDVDSISSITRVFDLSFYLKDIEVSTMSYGHDAADVEPEEPTPAEYTVTVDGVESTVAAGETVTLTTPGVTSDGGLYYRFYQWTVNEGDVTIENNSFVMPEGNVEIVAEKAIIGDINGDGKVNSRDSLALKRATSGLTSLEGAAKISGDINGDNKVNGTDAVMFKRFSTQAFTPSK